MVANTARDVYFPELDIKYIPMCRLAIAHSRINTPPTVPPITFSLALHTCHTHSGLVVEAVEKECGADATGWA